MRTYLTANLVARESETSTDVNTAILVVSCDKYSDLWPACFGLLFKYWPDCPFPIYLLSNFENYSDSRVTTITVGKDRNWSTNLANGLRKIKQDFVLVLMEDYLLDRAVNTRRMISLENYMEKRKAACLRLLPSPGPDGPSAENPEVGEIRKGAPYRLSLQAAIWSRPVLLGLLRWGESAWEFEMLGSRRADFVELPFLSVQRGNPGITYRNAVVKGRWDLDAIEFAKLEGVSLELGRRPVHRGQPFPVSNILTRLRIAFGKQILRKLRKAP
jgi:hypothetical protein